MADCCSAFLRLLVVLISKTLGRFLICFAVVTNECLSSKSFSSGLLLPSSVLFSDSVSKASKVSEWMRFANGWVLTRTLTTKSGNH